MMLVYFSIKGKRGFSCLCFAAQILSFGIEAHKSELFSIILSVVITLWYHKFSVRQFKLFLLWGLVWVCLVGMLELILFQTHTIVSLFVRRVMFVPNAIHQYYYDFFVTRGNELTWMRGGLIYFLGKYIGITAPYTQLPYIIGAIYYGNPETGANNGLLSEGVTMLGLAGAFITPMLIAVLLRLLDKSLIGLDKRMGGLIVMLFILNIMSSFFTTMDIDFIMLVFLLSMIRRAKMMHTT